MRRAGGELARGLSASPPTTTQDEGRRLALPGRRPHPRLNREPEAADRSRMRGIIDDRLLERWTTSRRHQDEARRFLARQRFSDPRGEGGALDEIAGTIADLESTLRERAARRRRPPPPPPGGPLSA